MAFMNMTAAYRIGLVMNVSRRHVRVKDNLIETGKTKVEDLGLQVIDPDDRVETMLHSFDPFVAIKSPVSIVDLRGIKVRPRIGHAPQRCS